MGKQAPLNWLRSFAAAARHNSFTRAAQDLNITQAAVSKQIRALESQLGCRLFQRRAHGLELTEQGRRYWHDTRELIRELDKVTTQFINRQQQHRVHLRCNISYSALVLPPRLMQFREQNPHIAIEMTHDIWEPAHDSDNAHIEIGYRLLDGFQNTETCCLLATGYLFPVVRADLPIEAVKDLPLIHVRGYYREWAWWLEQMQQHESVAEASLVPLLGQRRKNSVYDWHVDNSMAACQLAAQGLGIALGREYLVATYLQRGELTKLSQFPGLPAQEGFVIYLTAQGQGHAAAECLFEFLQAV